MQPDDRARSLARIERREPSRAAEDEAPPPKVRTCVRTRLAELYSPIFQDRKWRNGALRILCLNLTLVALSFAALELHRLGVIGRYTAWWLSSYNDYSAAEVAGYIEMGAASWLMFRVYSSTRSPFDLLLSGIAGFLMVDDLVGLHDWLRVLIGRALFTGTRLFSAQDLGEAVYTAIILGILLLLLISIGRRVQRDDVVRGLPFFAALVLLAFFAIGIDSVHQIAIMATAQHATVDWFIANVEDGGELVAMGLVLIAANAQYRSFCTPAPARDALNS